MLYELGILFNVAELMPSTYRAEAWKIFMRTCDPQRLAGCTLYEGETTATLAHQENVFCIANQTLDPQIIDYVKAAFIYSTEPGLMPPVQRFLGGRVSLCLALTMRARIDQGGRFCSWDEASVRQDQRLCRETGWGFGETVSAA